MSVRKVARQKCATNDFEPGVESQGRYVPVSDRSHSVQSAISHGEAATAPLHHVKGHSGSENSADGNCCMLRSNGRAM